ncbi:MAG: hypothetical protein HW390_894 [Candidatus Brocadiaceae bacterium]|nr:hypothetical protein [Candidatus Brocadiaceae bacterium]HJW87089.1 hypothetical protein [Candidatus Brocadiaceae bacterium]
MTLFHNLVSGWRNCNLESPPYLFPDDVSYITSGNFKVFQSFDEYVSSKEFGLSSDINMHTGLLPIPFVGNLEKATIFVLMLNPGLSAGDYFAEQQPEFRNSQIQNLRQENENVEYPFIFLNPQFAWHPGFVYWHKKFNDVIENLAKQLGTTYQEAMSILAKNLACLELLPYHSKSFGSGSSLKVLPSVKAMQNFVYEVLIPKAKDGKVTIIATRGVKNWQLPKHENIIIYEGNETRSAHLSLTSRGGMAIANHLSLLKQKSG